MEPSADQISKSVFDTAKSSPSYLNITSLERKNMWQKLLGN